MPDQITPTELRKNLYRILDEILNSGKALDITRKGQTLRITPVYRSSGLETLQPHPGTIVGDPEDIVHNDWSSYWSPDL
ncbi:MAG: hypothetical protein ACLFPG_12190 [Desulfohalobiaceae bacterium]